MKNDCDDCGWLQPRIKLVHPQGINMADVVVTVTCPKCGRVYKAGLISPDMPLTGTFGVEPGPSTSLPLGIPALVGDEIDQVRPFDSMIGRLDRLLSEFFAFAKSGKLDEADQQTIKHHADDLIGVGQAALKAVKP